uniref:Putative secreted protein n=1 Tax=Xenopsylla cheopis TaxID=163159 RepID=A0A6M2DYI6_XENCH
MLGAFNAMSPALIAAALTQAGLGAFNGTPQPRPLMEIAPQSLHNPGIFQNYRGRYNTPMGQDTEKQFMQQQRAPAPPAPYGNRVSGAPWNNNQQKSDQTWPSQISA